MIVDCHVHLNSYNAQDPRSPAESLRELQRQLDKYRIDHAIVLTSYLVNDQRPDAATVAQMAKSDPRISVVEGVGALGPTPVDWDGVEQRLRDGVTKGLKIYPGYEHAYPGGKEYAPVVALAAKYRVPLMIHSGDTYAPRAKLKYAHPLHVDDVAVDNPDVDFIICHLGNPWFSDTAELIYKNDNVHTDISGLVLEQFSAPLEILMRQELRNALLYSGDPDSILYGTDWPLVHMGPYLRFVDDLGLEPEHKEKLLSGNAMRLFRLR